MAAACVFHLRNSTFVLAKDGASSFGNSLTYCLLCTSSKLVLWYRLLRARRSQSTGMLFSETSMFFLAFSGEMGAR